MVERVEEIYQALRNAGISEMEIREIINEKEIEFQGFMTKPAILYLIAKEKGINVDSSENKLILNQIAEDIINYNDFTIPILSITEKMRNIVIAGRIKTIFHVKDFIRKEGTSGRVGSFLICDKSDCIKIVLWDEHASIMENELFQKGEIIQIIGGYSKKGRDGRLEIHLSRQGKIILAPENVVLPKIQNLDIKSGKSFEGPRKPIMESADKKSGCTIETLHSREGFIRFISGVVYVEFFKELTLKNGRKSFLLKLVLSDESSSIKVNVWGMQAVELVKSITDGNKVKLSNVIIRENFYTNEKELNLTKKSDIEVL
jgi:ssDNA-binding replication factor A large subunit